MEWVGGVVVWVKLEAVPVLGSGGGCGGQQANQLDQIQLGELALVARR